jgi:D-alanine-D-alanine ligase
MKRTKYSIAILMGGPSSEREVSLRSGRAAAIALTALGHRVAEIDLRSDKGEELLGIKADVAFLALHGRFGEDGEIQRLLEKRRLPYTGSGPVASRIALDKLESKRLFVKAGMETPAYQVLTRGDGPDELEACARSLGFPLVIKPRAEGSSVGVTVHHDRSRLSEGLELATRSGRTALMERFVEGREMTVGILDDRPLPVIELRNQRDLFDYAAKYQDGGTHVIVDPLLPQRDRVAIQMTALRAHRALGCEGATRVDLFLTPLHGIQVLEVNTIPGLTERSLLPRAARAAGIAYDELCEHMIRLGFKRRRDTGSWVAAALL